jgi:glucosamine--fructose-6-phosphate aminotransferase (isomerizing)
MSIPTPPAARSSEMYQTMRRQPEDLRRLEAEGWGPAAAAARLLAGARRVLLVGIGTSYHAALVGEWLFRGAGLDTRAVMSYDFAVYPEIHPLTGDDAVVVMAHSGTKTYSSRSMARAVAAGVTTLSVGSLTAEHPGSRLVLRTVERERSAAFTASHTAAMFVLAQVATLLAEAGAPARSAQLRRALAGLPEQVEAVLAREAEVEQVARRAADRQIYAAGAGPNAATALEAVIKAREAATARIDGLAMEQFLHGPLVTVNPEDFAVLVNVKGAAPATVERTSEIAEVLDRIGTPIWLVGAPTARVPSATVFDLPEVPELLSPILAVVPIQMLAQQLAVVRGANPDHFRRDDPRYARALSSLTL